MGSVTAGSDGILKDHVPIVARFRCRSQRGRNGLRHVAKEWFWSLAGHLAVDIEVLLESALGKGVRFHRMTSMSHE